MSWKVVGAGQSNHHSLIECVWLWRQVSHTFNWRFLLEQESMCKPVVSSQSGVGIMVQHHILEPFSQADQVVHLLGYQHGQAPSRYHIHLLPAGSFCKWFLRQKGVCFQSSNSLQARKWIAVNNVLSVVGDLNALQSTISSIQEHQSINKWGKIT